MTGQCPGGALWQTQAEGRFDWRQWGEDLVIFVLETGETHQLSPSSSAVLLTLLEKPGTARPAQAWLAAMADGGAEPASAESEGDLIALEQVLQGLAQLGAVDRLAP